MKKSVVYTGSRQFYNDMITAVKSLLCHTEVDKIYLLIVDDVFPFEMPDCTEAVNSTRLNFFHKGGPNYDNPWSSIILNRVAFTKLFPEEDLILSLDVDAIVDRDISPLWDYDMGGYYVAGVPEIEKSKNGKIYINGGVVLMNLKKIREDGIDDRMIRGLNSAYCWAPDQNVINEYCQGKILPLPSEYNSNSFVEPCKNPRIIHFAGIGEYFTWSGVRWRDEPIVLKYRNMKWETVLKQNM